MYMFSYNTGLDRIKMLPDIAHSLYNTIRYLLANNTNEHMLL